MEIGVENMLGKTFMLVVIIIIIIIINNNNNINNNFIYIALKSNNCPKR